MSSYPLPEPLVMASSEWLGGEPIFTGRRVPIRALFDYLEAGRSIDDFLEDYPSVSRQHVLAVIELARERLRPSATAA